MKWKILNVHSKLQFYILYWFRYLLYTSNDKHYEMENFNLRSNVNSSVVDPKLFFWIRLRILLDWLIVPDPTLQIHNSKCERFEWLLNHIFKENVRVMYFLIS
jgi:hypothetical protein